MMAGMESPDNLYRKDSEEKRSVWIHLVQSTKQCNASSPYLIFFTLMVTKEAYVHSKRMHHFCNVINYMCIALSNHNYYYIKQQYLTCSAFTIPGDNSEHLTIMMFKVFHHFKHTFFFFWHDRPGCGFTGLYRYLQTIHVGTLEDSIYFAMYRQRDSFHTHFLLYNMLQQHC
jgi:hypothetical protein